MLSKDLVLNLFEIFNIKRWNDFVSPVPFFEMDKQGHKMLIAYMIYKLRIQEKEDIDYIKLIEGDIFEILHRSILTDLKPNVSNQLMKTKKEEINAWVFEKLKDTIDKLPDNFSEKFQKYFFDENYSKKEKEILNSAHFLSTYWEFKIIEKNNFFSTRIESVKNEIEEKFLYYSKNSVFKKIISDDKISNFLGICAELRFQERWAQVIRVPKTSVLGHMYFVAVMCYFVSKELKFCDKRIYNNFFAALFHDMPEVLTKDIASPIKSSVSGLEDIIKEFENSEMEKNIYPLLPNFISEEIRYLLKEEFDNKIMVNGKIKYISTREILKNNYNVEKYNPVDGKVLRSMDHFSAFLEALMSINYGTKATQLYRAKNQLLKKYEEVNFNNIKLGDFFKKFL